MDDAMETGVPVLDGTARDALVQVESALHAVSCFGNCRQELTAFSAMRSVIRDVLGGSDPTFHLSLLDDAVWGRYG